VGFLRPGEDQLAVCIVVHGCGVDRRDGFNDVVVGMGWGYSGRDGVGTVLSCRADGVGVGVAVEVQHRALCSRGLMSAVIPSLI
jgi:hypothetical protein